MPDENTGTEETKVDETKVDEETENKGGDGTATDEAGKETEEEGNTESEEDFEPEVRKKDKKDFIIERLQKKNEKLQGKAQEEERSDEDLDDYEPNDISAVEKIVDKKLAPLVEQQRQAEDKAEVDSFVTENPQFKPYKDKMLKYRSHPAYEQVPIQHIANIVAGKDLAKLGASEALRAQEEAKQAQMGGGSARGKTGEQKSVWDMSRDEFAKEREKQLREARNRE